MRTDLELFNEIKKSNEKAFEILFDKYYRQLCSFCDYFVKDSCLSEELVADVFATIWIKRHVINVEYNLKNYLYIIAKNNSLAYLRKNKIETFPINNEIKNSRVSSCSPDGNMLQSDKEMNISHILDILPPKSRKVFELHKFEGFKYKEIADLLNISTKTVENHLGKALKILRENYKGKSSVLSIIN
jgi:RNA polymerase sigma-70 factor (ECF subfamily)